MKNSVGNQMTYLKTCFARKLNQINETRVHSLVDRWDKQNRKHLVARRREMIY